MTAEVLSSTGALGAFVFPAAVLGLCGLLSWMLLTRKSVTVVHDADEKVMCVKLLGYPFIGFSHMLLDIKRFPERYLELVDSVRHLFPNACPVLDMQMGLGRGRLIVAADAHVAREVLMKRPKTFRRAASLSDKLGGLEGARHNVFFSEGDFWGRMRRLTAPSFSHKNVTSMGVAVGEEVDALVARLTAAAGKDRVVQMDEEAFYFTIRVISAVAFGGMSGELQTYFYSKQLMEDVNSIFQGIFKRLVLPYPEIYWKVQELIFGPDPDLVADRRMVKFCKQVIELKKRELAAAGATADAAVSEKPTLVETLFKASSAGDAALSDAELLGNVKVFFLAGSDTTSVVLTWCVYHLCVDKELQRAVQAEADAVLTSGGGEMTGAEVVTAVAAKRLPLCAAVFHEALRLKGPAAFLVVTPTEDGPVQLCNGMEMRPGDRIMAFIDGVMRDPNVFPDPATFKPARWLNATEEMHKSMLGFGHGPRLCPGMNLALSEGIACLAAIVRRLDLALACPPEEIVRQQNFVTKANKLPVTVTLRR